MLFIMNWFADDLEGEMTEVWMVATGEDYEGLNQVKVMFSTESAARSAASYVDHIRNEHERWCDLCGAGHADWDDPNFQDPIAWVQGERMYVGQWTVVEKFEIHSDFPRHSASVTTPTSVDPPEVSQ